MPVDAEFIGSLGDGGSRAAGTDGTGTGGHCTASRIGRDPAYTAEQDACRHYRRQDAFGKYFQGINRGSGFF
ncbi:hypothetical protein [Sporomusa ovata]|uniref:hypothetical protein n=1 Tax=Sporomusa ovata TaxID=2378 RepID=UPI001F47D8B2|nr:hypothetical protein [Sporomusa ovata]